MKLPRVRLQPAPLAAYACVAMLLGLLYMAGCETLSISRSTPGPEGTAEFRASYSSLDGKKLAEYGGAILQMVNGAVPGGLLPWVTGGGGIGLMGIVSLALKLAHNKAWNEAAATYSPPPPVVLGKKWA